MGKPNDLIKAVLQGMLFAAIVGGGVLISRNIYVETGNFIPLIIVVYATYRYIKSNQ